MVNKVILVGNVGADPEIKQINEETQVAKLTLATSESYKNREGERVTQTEWHNVTVWRGLSKVVEQFVKKGSQLYIEGKITHKSYEKDGVTKYYTEIIANEIKLLGRKHTEESQNDNTEKPDTENTDTGEADDLPF